MVYEWSGDGETTHWRVLDIGDGEVLSEGDVDLFAQASVASPDGSTVAVAGDTGEIVTIDVSTGAEQRRSAGLGAIVLWLKYSDDGELLVSGADDGGVSLWDATTLDLLGTVHPPHRGEAGPGRRAVHRRQPRRGDRVARRQGLPVGHRPRPRHRLRLPDGRTEPDRGGVGGVPARPALPVRLPRRVRGGPDQFLLRQNGTIGIFEGEQQEHIYMKNTNVRGTSFRSARVLIAIASHR